MFLGETSSLTTRIVQIAYDHEPSVPVAIPFKASEIKTTKEEATIAAPLGGYFSYLIIVEEGEEKSLCLLTIIIA